MDGVEHAEAERIAFLLDRLIDAENRAFKQTKELQMLKSNTGNSKIGDDHSKDQGDESQIIQMIEPLSFEPVIGQKNRKYVLTVETMEPIIVRQRSKSEKEVSFSSNKVESSFDSRTSDWTIITEIRSKLCDMAKAISSLPGNSILKRKILQKASGFNRLLMKALLAVMNLGECYEHFDNLLGDKSYLHEVAKAEASGRLGERARYPDILGDLFKQSRDEDCPPLKLGKRSLKLDPWEDSELNITTTNKDQISSPQAPDIKKDPLECKFLEEIEAPRPSPAAINAFERLRAYRDQLLSEMPAHDTWPE